MPANKTDYNSILMSSEYSFSVSTLRVETVPTRQFTLINDALQKLQQQVAERTRQEVFWSGQNALPIRGVVIVGESGSGKSFGLKYAVQTLPPVMLPGGTELPSNSVYVSTPPQGTVSVLAKEVARVVDGMEPREPRDQDAPGKIIRALRRGEFTLAAIDEVSRIINPQRHVGRAYILQSYFVWATAIAALDLEGWPTPMALSGLPSILDSLVVQDKEKQAQELRAEAYRRMTIIRLPDLSLESDGGLLAGVLKLYCDKLSVESKIVEDDYLIPRIIYASLGQAGSALELLQRAVALAKVRPRGKLSRQDFAVVYADHTSACEAANPFLAENWERIDMRSVAPRTLAEAFAAERLA